MNSINNKTLYRGLSGFILVFFLVVAGSQTASAASYTVTNTNPAGAGSFRQAVEIANTSPGADSIQFDIAGSGPHDIIFSYLEVTDELHIDGTVGNGGSSCATDSMPAKPNIILNINGIWNQRLDFSSSADGSSIKGISYANAPQNMGLYANDFTMTCSFMDMLPDGTATEGYSGGGISVEKNLSNIKFGGSDIADRNYFALVSLQGAENVHGLHFENNYVGVNTTGSASSSIAHTQPLLYLCDSGNNIEIKNNLLSGNGGAGIRFRSGYGCTGADDLTNVSIKGNKIGSNAAGDAVLSTNIDAIHLQHYASNTISNINIGGPNPEDRNIIVGQRYGVLSTEDGGPTNGVTIENNYIGVGSDGAALGSLNAGTPSIESGLSAHGWKIKNNVVSGSPYVELFLRGDGHVVSGNKIGVDANANTVVDSRSSAVIMFTNDSIYSGNVIGGFSQSGFQVHGKNNQIKANYIGTNSSLSANLGSPLNGLSAIYATNEDPSYWGAENTLIGGANEADGNYIYNYSGPNNSLITLASPSINSTAVLGNRIFGNAAKPIDSNGEPKIINMTELNGNTNFSIDLNTNLSDGDYRLEFFSNPTAKNTHGQLDTTERVGTVNVTKSGTDAIEATIAGTGYTFPTITATKIDNSSDGYGLTSNVGDYQMPTDLQIETDSDAYWVEAHSSGYKITQTLSNLGPNSITDIDFNLQYSNCFDITAVSTSGTATDGGLYASSRWTGNLEPNQTLTLTFTGDINCSADGDLGFIHNITIIENQGATINDTTTDNNSYEEYVGVGDLTDLQMETDDGLTEISPHATNHKITQTITNLGPATVTELKYDTLDTNCFNITSTTVSGTATDTGDYDNLTWTGNLEPNQTLILTFTGDVSCSDGSQIYFFLGYVNSISSSIGDVFETNYNNNNHSDDNTQIREPQAPATDLAITTTLDNPEDVAIGGTLNYTLTLTNNGPEDIDMALFDGNGPNPFATSLFLDFMPFELNFIAGSSTNSDIPCSLFPLDTNDPGAASLLSSHPDHDIIQCTWDGGSSPILSAGQSISTTISTVIDASSNLSFTNHVVSGWAQNDPDFSTMLDPFSGATNQCAGYTDILDCYAGTGINNYAAVTPLIDLRLEQTLVNTGDISAGDTVNYDITITNKGPGALDLATLDGSLGTNSLLGNVYPAADITFVDDDNTDVSCMDFGPGSYAYLGPAGQDHPSHQLMNCFYSGSSKMLNPGDSLTVRLSFTANPGVGNKFTNYAVANGVSSDPETAQMNNLFGTATGDILDVVSNENYSKATYVGASAVTDLSLRKSLVNTGKISAGDTVNYDITIANDGPADLDLNTLNGSQGGNALFSDIYPGADLTFTDDNNPNVSCYDVGPGSIVFVGPAGQDHPSHQILSCVYIGGSQLLHSGDSLTIRLSFSANIGVSSNFINYAAQTGTSTDQDTQILGNMIGAATTDILDSISNGNFAKASYTYSPISTNNDNDNDGVSNIIEDAGPNGGDANNDGTLDSLQKNVTSFVNSTTNQRAVLSVSDDCTITTSAVVAESTNTKQDLDYVYPVGLMDFELDCGTPGYTADITQYYFDASDQDYIVRKYNTNNDSYADIGSAIITEETIAGKQVIKASYQIIDGGELDMDQTIDGNIVDPAGLALASQPSNTSVQVENNNDDLSQKTESLPKTGQSETTSLIIALGLLISSTAVFNNKREKNLG